MHKPLKKLIWYTFPLKTVGGGERLLLEGLRWFSRNGIDAYLFADGEPIAKEAQFDETYSPSVLIYPKAKYNTFFGQLRAVFQKITYLRDQNPDIVIANSQAEALRIYFYNLFSSNKLLYVCFIHGSFFQFPEDTDKYSLIFKRNFSRIRENDPVYAELIPREVPPSTLKTRIKREILNYLRYRAVRNAQAVFVLTEKAKFEVELLYGHSNVVTAHGAFSNNIFSYNLKEDKKAKWNLENRFIIFSMCRLVAKKRVDLILRSFSLFVKKNPLAFLQIGGNGPEKESLKQLAEELNVSEMVQFLGYVPDDELLDYYCSSDIFVTADNADYDITTFVALALGKRVVASAQHEFEPHLNELNLLFHAEPTAEGFARAYQEATQLKTIDLIGKDKVQALNTYTWEYYFDKIKMEIERILN